ncbi:hypothetical protein HELRODRAFT_172873 [Helobdella robusta]|uniref:Uncharacterized protein n=1 Tax=Helobdella robusta TaxID=6412 RepID=T1F619_HELRO|nr:hypothetical protein HELRODRAFT_172873 [Helobdella robusta]ESO03850.1 hypothetical protein HELRODRAFT_172873 [Helobdella robusta]
MLKNTVISTVWKLEVLVPEKFDPHYLNVDSHPFITRAKRLKIDLGQCLESFPYSKFITEYETLFIGPSLEMKNGSLVKYFMTAKVPITKDQRNDVYHIMSEDEEIKMHFEIFGEFLAKHLTRECTFIHTRSKNIDYKIPEFQVVLEGNTHIDAIHELITLTNLFI